MLASRACKIIGHRGAAGVAPENTLRAFQAAIDLDCDYVEMDVHLSKDGVPVVIHDPLVNRTTNGSGLVKHMTVAELKRLDAGDGERIPTLQEVVDLCKGKVSLQVELKSPGTPEAVYTLLVQNGIIESSVVTSFHQPLLRELFSLDKRVRTGLLFSALDSLPFFFFPTLAMRVAILDHVRYICPWSHLVTAGMVRMAHERGLRVSVYFVNTLSLGRRLARMGVDEIGTNYPSLFTKGVL